MKTKALVTVLALVMLSVPRQGRGGEAERALTWQDFKPVSFQQDAMEEAGSDPCAECCADPCCCPPTCWRLFGELLYLRPRDAEVAYAVPIDGAIGPPDGAAPVQVGRIGVCDPDYEPGFRVGFGRQCDACSELAATFTHFESNTFDQVSTEAPLVVRSLVVHPGTLAAATDYLWAQAEYGIDFQLLDLDYRRLLCCGDLYAVNYLAGVRYGHLDQDFRNVSFNTGVQTVETDIQFDGGGLRLGLEGERLAPCCGLLIYGRATASFVAGEFKATYFQANAFDPEVVDTRWEAGRIVTMLDLELGLGWMSPCGRYRFTTGYMVNGWFNTVKTDEWINAVHHNDFAGLGDTLTFDGWTARAEIRF